MELLSSNDILMVASNLVFLIVAIRYFRIGLNFDGVLNLLLFLFSTNYHNCYRSAYDSEPSFVNYLCFNPINRIYTSLMIDVLLANLVGFSAFVKLIPLPTTEPTRKLRDSLVIGDVFVFLFASIINYSLFFKDYWVDHTPFIIICTGTYYLVLYCIAIIVYDYSIMDIIHNYKRNFYLGRVVIALGFGIFGIFLWLSFNHLISINYFKSHPLWHIIIGGSNFLYSFAFVRDQNGNILVYY